MVLNFISNNLAFVIFIALLSIFLYFKRSKVEVQGSFPFFYMIMYKTTLGLDKMKSWSHKKPRLFLYLAYLSMLVGIAGLFLSMIFMFYQLFIIIDLDLTTGGGLVLPIKTDSGTIGGIPVVAPPFFEWLISLAVLVIVHEFAHGVIAQRFNIGIKSSGFAFGALIAPILPAAFVEPDEKQLKKAKWWHQISVFGAGSTSNFIFGVLFYLMFVFAAIPFVSNTMQVDSISFNEVMNQSTLLEYGITEGNITAINNKSVSELYFFVSNVGGTGFTDVVYVGFNFSLNQTVNLTIDNGTTISTYAVKTFANPQNNVTPMIGISGVTPNLDNRDDYAYLGTSPLFIQRLLFWIVILNIGIGIMNLLPLWITDGGQILRTLLLKRFKEERAYKILNWVSFIALATIILLLFPSLLKSIVALFP